MLEGIGLSSSPGLQRRGSRPVIDSALCLSTGVRLLADYGHSLLRRCVKHSTRTELILIPWTRIRKFLLETSSVLRRLNIVRVQAPLTSYWAIGPRDLLVGDWLIPVLVMEPGEFVPTLAGENMLQMSSSEWHVCYCSEASKRNEQSPDSSGTHCIMQLQ